VQSDPSEEPQTVNRPPQIIRESAPQFTAPPEAADARSAMASSELRPKTPERPVVTSQTTEARKQIDSTVLIAPPVVSDRPLNADNSVENAETQNSTGVETEFTPSEANPKQTIGSHREPAPHIRPDVSVDQKETHEPQDQVGMKPIMDIPIPEVAKPVESASQQTTMPEFKIDVTTGTSRQTAATTLSPSVPSEELERTYKITDQIIRSAQVLTRDGATQVTLRLDPPELGEVTIRLSSQNQMVSGEISVENQKVHDIVQRHMNTLRESLASQGVQLNQIDVSIHDRASSFDREAARQFADHNQNNARSQDQRQQQRPAPQWDMPRQQTNARTDGRFDFVA
jgi:flagellar hook-length control protein FliK